METMVAGPEVRQKFVSNGVCQMRNVIKRRMGAYQVKHRSGGRQSYTRCDQWRKIHGQ